MNVTDDLEPKLVHHTFTLSEPLEVKAGDPILQRATLNEGTYRVTNRDGTTGTITVPTGSSLTIWTQSTIERV